SHYRWVRNNEEVKTPFDPRTGLFGRTHNHSTRLTDPSRFFTHAADGANDIGVISLSTRTQIQGEIIRTRHYGVHPIRLRERCEVCQTTCSLNLKHDEEIGFDLFPAGPVQSAVRKYRGTAWSSLTA